MHIKKLLVITAACALVLTGCNRPEPALEPVLARITADGVATDIPLDTYRSYLQVIGQLNAEDGQQSLMATAALLSDLEGTDFAPDMDYFATESRRQLDERLAQDPGYGVRLEQVAGALGIGVEEVYALLRFDDLSQYAAQLMYNKLWTDMEDDEFIDDTLSEEEQKANKDMACEALYEAYIDGIAARAEATDDPAVYLVDGETVTLEGDAAAFIDFCRYMTHLESTYEIMELTAFINAMQKFGATFDDEAIAAEADKRVAEFYTQAEMAEWVGEVCAQLGIQQADFDASYHAMQQLSIRYYYCSDAFAASYEARPESQRDMDEISYFMALVEQLMADCEVVDIRLDGTNT